MVLVRRGLVGAAFLYALGRFLLSAWIPATRMLTGDFAAAFPSGAVAWLRPDFPTTNAIGAGERLWNYGPLTHVVTLPLLLAPSWSAVPAIWATMNLAMLAASLAGLVRLASTRATLTREHRIVLASMWLLFQPLATCFTQGNIEIAELAMLVAAFVLMANDRFASASVWLSLAAMTKFLPAGFIGWLVLKRRWRAVGIASATLAVLVLITAFTLRWDRSVTFKESGSVAAGPSMSGVLDSGVPSIFFHRTTVFDWGATALVWFPESRMAVAANAGRVASAGFAIVFAALLIVRRREALFDELGILCLLMFLIAPWDHDYYYIFALAPLTLVSGPALAARDRPTLTVCAVAYCLMSPPVPYSWINRAHLVGPPFAYWWNTHDFPTAGALLLLVLLTARLLGRPTER